MTGLEYAVVLVVFWVSAVTGEPVLSHIVYPNMPACIEGEKAGKKVFEVMQNDTVIMKCQKAMVSIQPSK